MASVACACVRFRWFRFMLFSRLGVKVVVRSMLLKRNRTGILKSRGFEVVSIPRRNWGALDPRGMHAVCGSINSIVGIGWSAYPRGIDCEPGWS